TGGRRCANPRNGGRNVPGQPAGGGRRKLHGARLSGRAGPPVETAARSESATRGAGKNGNGLTAGSDGQRRLQAGRRAPKRRRAHQLSSPISSARALCVSQPIAIRSTPVAATAGAVSGVMPPDASVTARPL